ncbi:hypothetical protein WDU94_009715 [Cyamophila willieti]
METNVLRVLILIILFFLLTCEYSTFISKLLSDDNNETEVLSDVNKPKPISRRSKDKSYYNNEISLSEVMNGEEDEDEEEEDDESDSDTESKRSKSTFQSVKKKMISTMKNSCLPKLICELNASTNKDALTEGEKSLLRLIRETSISMTAEVTSKYHFAAHMGQLISGIDGNGCHNFYPSCPLAGVQILNMLKKDKVSL